MPFVVVVTDIPPPSLSDCINNYGYKINIIFLQGREKKNTHRKKPK